MLFSSSVNLKKAASLESFQQANNHTDWYNRIRKNIFFKKSKKTNLNKTQRKDFFFKYKTWRYPYQNGFEEEDGEVHRWTRLLEEGDEDGGEVEVFLGYTRYSSCTGWGGGQEGRLVVGDHWTVLWPMVGGGGAHVRWKARCWPHPPHSLRNTPEVTQQELTPMKEDDLKVRSILYFLY